MTSIYRNHGISYIKRGQAVVIYHLTKKEKMGNFNLRPVATTDNSEPHPTGTYQPGRPIRRRTTILNLRFNSITNDVETSESPQPNGYEKLVNISINNNNALCSNS